MAIFAALKWELGIVEAIIVIMSVGLSVDFVVHFGVGYIHTDAMDIEQERKKIKNRYLPSKSVDQSEVQITPSKSLFLISKERKVIFLNFVLCRN